MGVYSSNLRYPDKIYREKQPPDRTGYICERPAKIQAETPQRPQRNKSIRRILEILFT